MLMAAATHMVGSAHSSSISPPKPQPPWHPVVLVPNYHQQQQVHYGLDVATPSPSPSPTTPAAIASPPRHTHLRAASRRAGKPPRRRPRPSRKLPTTYISTDAASFRRMVHQVTGADDDAPEAGPELLCRPATSTTTARPSLGALATTTTLLLLPTLDTSAFLLGAAAAPRGADSGRAPPARPHAASCCHGSAVEPEACGAAGSGGGGRGFPSLESWDEDDAIFF